MCMMHYSRWYKCGDPGEAAGRSSGPKTQGPPEQISYRRGPQGYTNASVWPGHKWYSYALQPSRGKVRRENSLHRLVMADALGRPLERHESVHHIDGDRSNNTLGNLQMRSSAHGPGVVLKCRCCGSQDIESIQIDGKEAGDDIGRGRNER